MNIFKRILKIGQAEIHALVEKMENPTTRIEQGIDDMKQQLSELTESYITNRALIIKNENNASKKNEEANEFEQKAFLILQKAQQNELDATKAEELALEALNIKKKLIQEATDIKKENSIYVEKTSLINEQIEILNFNIAKWEKELKTLKAKQRINTASEFANRQMASFEGNSTIDLLEKMKAKIEEKEAYTEALNEMYQQKVSKDIDSFLRNSESDIQDELKLLKDKLRDHE